jgi:hypothetical protein
MPAFAQTSQASKYNLETQEDALNLLDAANKGDEEAIQKLQGLKAFNKDELNKVLKDKKFTSADKVTTFDFGDGSSIEIEIVHLNKDVAKDTRQLQSDHEHIFDFIFRYYVGGIAVATYTLTMDYMGDGNGNVWNGYSWHTGSRIYPYSCVPQGYTSNLVTQGLFVKSQGTCWIDCYSSFNLTVKGYCYDDIVNNWYETYVS